MSDNDELVVKLFALATYAEKANHWTDDKRLMDAAGVADAIHEGIDRIEELEAKLEDRDAMVEAAYRMALDDAAASYEVNYLLAKRLGVEIPAYHLDLRAVTPPADLVERVKGETK